MNRIASLAAGTLTTALVGASIAAVGASQGVLPIVGQGGGEEAATWSETAGALEEAWPGTSAVAATEQPATATTATVIYVDKEPIVVTKEVLVPASPRATTDSRGLAASSPTEAPALSPTATEAPASDGGGAGSAPAFAPPPSSLSNDAAPPADPPAPAAVAPAPPPPAPVATLASDGGPSAGSSYDGSSDDDYNDDDEHEDDDGDDDGDDEYEDDEEEEDEREEDHEEEHEREDD